MIFHRIVLDLYAYDLHKNAEKAGVISFLSQILCQKAVVWDHVWCFKLTWDHGWISFFLLLIHHAIYRYSDQDDNDRSLRYVITRGPFDTDIASPLDAGNVILTDSPDRSIKEFTQAMVSKNFHVASDCSKISIWHFLLLLSDNRYYIKKVQNSFRSP